MFNEKFMDTIAHEGVVSIVTFANSEAHVVNTWNSYLNVSEGNKLLIPAAGMIKTERYVNENNEVKVTLGSKEVMGYRSMGTGFLLAGKAKFLKSGPDFEMMKEKFPFLSRVLEIEVTSYKQTL